LLRAEVAARTAIGNEVAQLVERGELVPDVVVLSLVLPKVLTAAVEGGYILDGFPRSVDQAVLARKLGDQINLAPNAVVYLDVAREELVRRIVERAKIEGRADDNVATVKNRLSVFDDATLPLIDYYRDRGVLHVIDAAQDADSVTDSIVKALHA
jgi:adenylate kinase